MSYRIVKGDMDTTSPGPLIHIISNKNSTPQSRKSIQLPNRNRTIPVYVAGPNRTTGTDSSVTSYTDSSSSPRNVRDRLPSRPVADNSRRPVDSITQRSFPSSSFDGADSHNSIARKRYSNEEVVQTDRRRAFETKKDHVAEEVTQKPSEIPSVSENPGPSQEPTPSAVVPKKKKQKPSLSVPVTAHDVSKNWEQIRSAIGAGKRPRRTKPAQTTRIASEADVIAGDASASISNPAPCDGSELPTADSETFVKTKSFSGLTRAVAMDCEFVGVGPGGRENMLARVSLVNLFGHCLYDTFVKPTELVKDYRTHVSGVRPQDLKKGEDFKSVQQKVADILKDRILIGHAIGHDLEALLLSHPRNDIRDTSKYKPFRMIMKGGTPSLKKLTAKVLGVAVQTGEHDSIQDAQAAMRLYTMHKKTWESQLSFRGKKLRLKAKTNQVVGL